MRARKFAPAAIAALVVALIAAVAITVAMRRGHETTTAASVHQPTSRTPTPTSPGVGDTAESPTTTQRPGITLDLHAHSTTDPSSIWVVINKRHPIHPLDYQPPHLAIVRGYQVAPAAAVPLGHLLAAGSAAGLGLKIESAYRSYAYQVAVHDQLVETEGAAAADEVSARPGYSEHQTGLAVDLVTPAHTACDFKACFANTPAGRWLAANSWRFGFIVRYTAANEAITGYSPEPWHLRYIGVPLATAMHRAGITTLEQVSGIPGGR